MNILERFDSHVEPEPMSGCFLWTGTTSRGYGYFWIRGRMFLAHRFAYEVRHGSTRLDILHSCDNPTCVNPLHLRAGTVSDNMQDMVRRGRCPNLQKTHCPKGHAYDYISKNRRRSCLTCINEWTRTHPDKVRAAYRKYDAKRMATQ